MYAVIKTGGKQYRVSEGDTIRVEKLPAEEGASIELDQVLMIADGAKVTASVAGHGRAKKVYIVKFRRRKHFMKRAGHRQDYTELKITGIAG